MNTAHGFGRYVLAALGPLLLMLPVAKAQTPAAPPVIPDQTDVSKVELRTANVNGSVYAIEGFRCSNRRLSSCATVGAFVGPDGVLLVDSGSFPQLTDRIVAALLPITDKPVRFLINTHPHSDHVAGNENFRKMGALILGPEDLRRRLVNPEPGPNGTPAPTPPPGLALPVITYQERLVFHMNGEDVEAIHVARAHTDGDTVVRFPAADVIMTGDIFRNLGYPDMNLASGGSLEGMLHGLGIIIGLAGPKTRVVPGHGDITDRARVIAFRDMLLVLRDRVAALMQQGKTVEEIVAARPNAEYDQRLALSPSGSGGSEATLRQLYAELKRTSGTLSQRPAPE